MSNLATLLTCTSLTIGYGVGGAVIVATFTRKLRRTRPRPASTTTEETSR